MNEKIKGKEIIKKVEDFIQRLHNLDYIIDPKAFEITYTVDQITASLTDHLGREMANYEQFKDDDTLKLNQAKLCLIWIDKALVNGVIREGEGLIRKLQECKKKNIELEKKLEKCTKDYLELKSEFQKNYSEVSEVTEENDSWKEKYR